MKKLFNLIFIIKNEVNRTKMTSAQQREEYQNILGGMSNSFTTNQVPQKFNPQGGVPGGDLPSGEVDMSQIMNIMGKK